MEIQKRKKKKKKKKFDASAESWPSRMERRTSHARAMADRILERVFKKLI